MNSVSEMGLGLANFAVFAKVANWLRTGCEISLRLRTVCEISFLVDPALLLILSSTASHFLHFALIFPLIFGLVDG